MRANVDGSRAFCSPPRRSGVEKIVYCSSVAALGLTGTRRRDDETTRSIRRKSSASTNSRNTGGTGRA